MTLIIESEKLGELVNQAVEKAVKEHVPPAIKRGTRKQWLTSAEAQEYLQISKRTLQHLRDSRAIPFSQHGRKIRYQVDDLDAYLMGQKVYRPGHE